MRSSSRTTSIRSRRTTSTSEIERANREDYDAVVILLDTPGGLSSSMQKIYKAELASPIPVIVYVSPEGSRAASAGVWIAQAADSSPWRRRRTSARRLRSTSAAKTSPRTSGARSSTTRPHRSESSPARMGETSSGPTPPSGGRRTWAPREALKLNVIDEIAPDLPTLLDTDRRTDDEGLEEPRPAHGRRGDHHGRHVALEEDPRHADRSQPDRPLHVDRDARHHRRALEPRAHLPRHRSARSS